MAEAVRVELGEWTAMRTHAEPVRHAVFVEEQKVPAEIELDGFDPVSVHALAFDREGRVLGTGRLLPDGHIGRMAVLPGWRGRGVGRALLEAAIRAAQARGHTRLQLSAQTHAAGFYARAGFVAAGTEYEEAGIPHVAMQKRLD